jgi:Tol biopolymer transport system component/DNA-binding winged helix-turn-helix (wHTH) protein
MLDWPHLGRNSVGEAAQSSCPVRFGTFEVDLRAGELRKSGVKLKLTGQPFQVLAILLQHPGEVVTREELQKRLWPDTFVDVDHNLNAAVNKIRDVLKDSAESPRFVETLPRRGYRFIAPVESNGPNTKPQIIPPQDATTRSESRSRSKILPYLAVSTALAVLAIAAFFGIKKLRSPVPEQRALTRLTFDEGLQVEASWSPDGRFIAYSSDRGGKFDIWVQQVSGGDPVQITKGPGHHWEPDWSPDGKYIAYRSEEGDGGIYVVPALGGAGLEHRIAPFGYYPRWSPDSSQVLLQTHFTDIDACNRFYVAQLDGGVPREVLAEPLAQDGLCGAAAVWHPDGKRLTVWIGDASPTPVFWTAPLAGGPGIKMEIGSEIQRELAQASGEVKAGQHLGEYSFSWSPSGNAIYFERGYRGARNIWKMSVDPGTLRATRIDRLTTGPGPDAALAVSADGRRLAFTAKSQRIQTWLFPFDAKTGQIKGNGTAITSPGRTSIEPNLSQDGTKIAYYVPHGESYGPGFVDVQNDVWVKSLVDGSEIPIPADGFSRWTPLWSPDGTQLIYDRRNLRTNVRQLMLWSSQTHQEEPLTGVAKTLIYDWSRDGKWLSYADRDGILLISFPIAPNAQTTVKKVTSNPGYELYQAHLSPDNRWIVFEAVANSPNPESALYVVPASGGPWTRITDGRHWDDKPRWSPDGGTIYFVSGPGGFFNIWGIRFDPAQGKPVGQPFQISKFDSPRLMILRSIAFAGLSFTQNKLVMNMAEESGSIWLLDNVDQ